MKSDCVAGEATIGSDAHGRVSSLSAAGVDVRPVECRDSSSTTTPVSRCSGLVRMSAQSSAATPRARLCQCCAGRGWCGCPPSRVPRIASAATPVLRWSGLVRMSAQSSAAAGWATSVSRCSALVWRSAQSSAANRRSRVRRVALVGLVRMSAQSSAVTPRGRLRRVALVGAGADVRPVECSDLASAATLVLRWSGLVRMSAQSSAVTPRALLCGCCAGRGWCGCPPSRVQ
jgi:hypothetical protein